MLYLGLLLALYDGAEVVLKPVFGSLADRVGARPGPARRPRRLRRRVRSVRRRGRHAVDLAGPLGPGRIGFGVLAGGRGARGPSDARGRARSRVRLLRVVQEHRLRAGPGPRRGHRGDRRPALAVRGHGRPRRCGRRVGARHRAGGPAAAAGAPDPLRRPRSSRLGDRSFLHPTAALAAATAALSVGVGFLPVSGAAAGLGPVVTGGAVSLLAVTAALVTPGRPGPRRRSPAPVGGHGRVGSPSPAPASRSRCCPVRSPCSAPLSASAAARG